MRSRLNELKAERNVLSWDIENIKSKIRESDKEKESAEEAHAILIQATNLTQKNIGDFFSELVNHAFSMIWEDPYSFLLDFVERRNRIECDIWFVRNGKKRRPMYSTGGGTKDVASFILRLAYARLEGTSPILVLDEPLKNLDSNRLPLAIEMMKFLSAKFGIQIVMNTHIDQIAEQADKTFDIDALTKNRRTRN